MSEEKEGMKCLWCKDPMTELFKRKSKNGMELIQGCDKDCAFCLKICERMETKIKDDWNPEFTVEPLVEPRFMPKEDKPKQKTLLKPVDTELEVGFGFV